MSNDANAASVELQSDRSAASDSRGATSSHTEPTPSQVAAEAAAIYPDTFDTPPSPEEIAEEAYKIYVARGAESGQDVDDWLEAERRISDRRRSGTERAPRP